MTFQRKRRRITRPTDAPATAWQACENCHKTRVRENMVSAGDGQRWYCTKRCLSAGERQYRGRPGKEQVVEA